MAVAIGTRSEMKRCVRIAALVLILIPIGGKISLSQSQSPPQPAAKQPTPSAQQAVNTPEKGAETKAAPGEKASVGEVSDAANSATAGDAQKLSPEKQRAKDQLTQDTAKLYELANELKIEMNKSTKDTLSLNVIRKADELEKLAKKVRAEMRASLGN